MPLFSYTAVDDRKERIQGMVDAMSLQAARSALQGIDLFIEEIHEATPSEREGAKPWETVAVAESSTVNNVGMVGKVGLATYFPLLDTLRLYAGWLLAWYVLVVTLGAYQETKELPFTIPLVEGLWQSVLILRAAFGVFLFVMLSSLYRFFRSRGWMGGGLGMIGGLLFYVFLVNT